MRILNEIQGEAITYLPAFFYVFGALGIIGALVMLADWSNSHSSGVCGLIGLVVAIISLTIILNTDGVPTGKYGPTQYEVIITDENYVINASEYKIVEKRGEIYLIEGVLSNGN